MPDATPGFVTIPAPTMDTFETLLSQTISFAPITASLSFKTFSASSRFDSATVKLISFVPLLPTD